MMEWEGVEDGVGGVGGCLASKQGRRKEESKKVPGLVALDGRLAIGHGHNGDDAAQTGTTPNSQTSKKTLRNELQFVERVMMYVNALARCQGSYIQRYQKAYLAS